jgi:hypothetical protein
MNDLKAEHLFADGFANLAIVADHDSWRFSSTFALKLVTIEGSSGGDQGWNVKVPGRYPMCAYPPTDDEKSHDSAVGRLA